MDTVSLRERMEAIRWFHTMELSPGVWTRGSQGAPRNGTLDTLERLRLPKSFAGKTVLDVGAWDGFFSFEAERRGAARVLATDYYSWEGDGWGTQQGFLLAREALNSKVEALSIDPMDLSLERVGAFDVVFFSGVLYHLRHPLLGIERVAAVCKELLILETSVDRRLSEDFPAMAFYPGKELNNDESNWWGPNVSAVEAMLRSVGFASVETFQGKRGTSRVTFHARR